jgi:hypothetical protein
MTPHPPPPKVIFMAPQARLDEIRSEVEAAMAGRATLTTALAGMLEVGGAGWLAGWEGGGAAGGYGKQVVVSAVSGGLGGGACF